MNIIQSIKDKFEKEFKDCDCCPSYTIDAEDALDFTLTSIKEVLERTVTDTCEGQPIEIDIGMVGDFLKQLDEHTK